MNGLNWGKTILYEVLLESSKYDLDRLCEQNSANEKDLLGKYNYIVKTHEYRPTLFLTHIPDCETRLIQEELDYYRNQYHLLQENIYKRYMKILQLLR